MSDVGGFFACETMVLVTDDDGCGDDGDDGDDDDDDDDDDHRGFVVCCYGI